VIGTVRNVSKREDQKKAGYYGPKPPSSWETSPVDCRLTFSVELTPLTIMALSSLLSLTAAQRSEIESYLRKRNLRASVAQRIAV
jgi:hypothetical protein